MHEPGTVVSYPNKSVILTIFYGVQLSKHFTYPNSPWSHRVPITDFLLYSETQILHKKCM